MTNRMLVSPRAALYGPRGDVCPEPATIGAKLRHFGQVTTTVGAAVLDGGPNGRQAFAVDRWEVPT